MLYNMILIVNKPSAAVSVTSVEFNSYEAAMAAVESLKEGLQGNSMYSVNFFVVQKGRVSL